MLLRGRYVVPAVLLSIVGGCAGWWYLDCPRDLHLEGVEVGRIAHYADLKGTPQQDHSVVRVSFSSSKDLRKMMLAEDGGAGTDVIAQRCDCDEAKKRRSGENCAINLGPFAFDRFGEIQKYHDVRPERSSRLVPDETRILYHFYLPVEQWGEHEEPYNLARKPADICVKITRFGFLEPTRTSNVIVVTKEQLASAAKHAGLE